MFLITAYLYQVAVCDSVKMGFEVKNSRTLEIEMDRTTAIPRRSSLNPPKSFPSISRTLCNSSREPTGMYVSVRKVPHSRACSTIFSFFERHTPDTSCFECPAAKRLRVSRRKTSNHLPPPPKECSRVHTQKPAVPHLNQQYIAAAVRSPMAIARTECTFQHTHTPTAGTTTSSVASTTAPPPVAARQGRRRFVAVRPCGGHW